MKDIDKVFTLIDAIFFFIERANLNREEKDAANRRIREKFDSLPHPSTLEDTVGE